MNALINLKGEVKNCELTFYIPKSCCDPYGGYSPNEVCEKYNVEAVCSISDEISNCHIKMARNRNEEPFLWIHVKDPLAVIKPICNVKVEIAYTFSILGWIKFGLVKLYRFIRAKKPSL